MTTSTRRPRSIRRLNVFEQFQPELPAGFERSDYVFLANIDPVLQGQVLDQIRARVWWRWTR